MTALTIGLPNSVHAKIRELAARDEISVNQFIASAAAEKLAPYPLGTRPNRATGPIYLVVPEEFI